MKSFLALAAGALIAGIGLVVLMDATQNRPDVIDRDSESTLVFEVSMAHTNYTTERAATALWDACFHPGRGRPALEQVSGNRFSVTLKPGLGEHATRRLRGCLQDVSIDHVQGKVVSITTRSTARS